MGNRPPVYAPGGKESIGKSVALDEIQGFSRLERDEDVRQGDGE
jgi:hypothetical protein